MIDDQIRKYARAEISEEDSVEIKITRIATNAQGKMINPIPVTPLNISARGVKFCTEFVFPTGIMLDLVIKIEDKIIQTTAKIVRMEKAGDIYAYGVTFGLVKEYNSVIIASFVKRKTIDQIRNLRGQ